jgi:nuclease HARBI1
MILTRLPVRYMSYKYRYLGLNTLERMKLRKIRSNLSFLINVIRLLRQRERYELVRIFNIQLMALMMEYDSIAMIPADLVPPRVRNIPIRRTIDSFNDSQCYRFFRMDSLKLTNLFNLLQFPENIALDNGSVFTGEEIFLFGLHRYGYPSRLEDLTIYYGRDYSQLSRAFKWFNTFIMNTWGYKICDNLEFWKPYLPGCAFSIANKLTELSGVQYDPDNFRVAMFIDCTVIATRRPGSGPTPDGNRYNNFIQMSFFNGWKRHHGLKFQSIELPNGMCMDMFGPRSFRQSDLELLDDSDIHDKIENLLRDEPNKYAMYGDGIYPVRPHLIGKHFGGQLDHNLVQENVNMARIRIGNEWNYGITAKLYPFVKFKHSFNILFRNQISNYYLVATFFRNCLIAIRGDLTTDYFDLAPPTIEEYLN